MIKPSIYVICAMIGNFRYESHINPGVWEGLKPVPWDTNLRGYGLGQWTNFNNPRGRLWKFHIWFEQNGYSITDGDKQLEYLEHENYWIYGNDKPESLYFKTLKDFLTSKSTDITMLTHAYNASWEGVKNNTWDLRAEYANNILSYIKQHYNDPAIKGWITPNNWLSDNQKLNNAVMVYRHYHGGYIPPDPPTPPIKKHKGMPIWMYPDVLK